MLIPWIGASFLSIYPAYYSVYYQYQGFVIPFMFLALVKSIERLNFKKTKRIFGVLFITTFIISLFIFSSPQTPYKVPVPNERLQMLDKILPFIPSSASILTENDLFPHISDRTDAYMYLPQDSNISIDYILVDVGSFWYTWQQPNAFGDRSAPQIYTEEVLKDGSFGVYASAGTIILLKRGYSGEPILFIPFNSKYDYGSLIRDSGSTIHDSTSASKNVFFHNGTDPLDLYGMVPTLIFHLDCIM